MSAEVMSADAAGLASAGISEIGSGESQSITKPVVHGTRANTYTNVAVRKTTVLKPVPVPAFDTRRDTLPDDVLEFAQSDCKECRWSRYTDRTSYHPIRL